MADKPIPAYNITGPTVITPPSPSNIVTGIQQINVLTEGSAGSLVLNDCATLAAASIANEFCVSPYTQEEGLPIDWPVQNGLVVSQVPTGGVFSVLYEILVVD